MAMIDQPASLTDGYGNADTVAYAGTLPTAYTNSDGRAITMQNVEQNYNPTYYTYPGQLLDAQSPQWRTGPTDGSGMPISGQHSVYTYSSSQNVSSLELATMRRGAGNNTSGYNTADTAVTNFGYSGVDLTTVTTPLTMSGSVAVTRTWTLGYDGQNRLVSITSPISGTSGQPGYTPAYTTAITYTAGTTQVVAGYGSSAPLTTTYTLDGQGEATQVADGLGHATQYRYDADHDVTSATDPNGNTTTTTYRYVGQPTGLGVASTGLVSQTVGPPVGVNSLPPSQTTVQVTTSYSYDGSNNLTEVHRTSSGGLGEQDTHYSYDAHHGLLGSSELLGTSGSSPVTYQWRCSLNAFDGYGELTATTDGRGTQASSSDPTGACSLNPSTYASYQRSYGYNGAGDRTTASTPPITTSMTAGGTPSTGKATTTTGYDGDGEATSVQSANGNTTATAYDHLGRAAKTTLPSVTLFDGSAATPASTTQYDGDGNIMQRTDAAGDVTRTSYDPLGRLVATIDPTNGQTINTYSATNLTATTDPRGQTSQRFYDAAGRLTEAIDPLGNYTTTAYDNDGNALTTTAYSSSGAQLSQDSRQYNSMNWATSETRSGPGVTSETTQYAYDIDGHPILEQDANGEWHQLIYDMAGQLLDSTISSSSLTVLNEEQDSYDNAGNRYFTLGLDGQSHTDTLDGDNRATQSLDQPVGGSGIITTTATFDPDGNGLTRSTAQAGVATQQDSAAYNAADWRTQTTDNGLATAYGYDAAARRRTSSVVNTSTPLRATLDGQGRATALGENIGGTTSYTATFGYDPNGDLTSAALPGGVGLSPSYDSDSRLQSVSANGPTGVGNPLSSSYSYGYDGLSRTIAVTSTVSGTPTTVSYTHDGLGRLTGAGGQTFSYLPDGNLGQVISGTATISYTYGTAGQPNELTGLTQTGQPTLSFGYDSGGTRIDNRNLTVANSGGYTAIASTNSNLGADCPTGQPDPNSTCMAYDAQGRLKAATMPSGTKVTLTYNAAGLRASYSVTPSGAGQPSLVEMFTYRGGALGQVAYTGTGVTTPYTDTLLYRQGGAPYELVRQTSTGSASRYWYATNGHGDVVALTDTSGTVVDRYRYDAWGVPTIDLENIQQPLLYAGYWYDRELHLPNEATGWYWLSARSYDPALKRFLQPDPIGFDGARSYVYAGDDPPDARDPSGLWACRLNGHYMAGMCPDGGDGEIAAEDGCGGRLCAADPATADSPPPAAVGAVDPGADNTGAESAVGTAGILAGAVGVAATGVTIPTGASVGLAGLGVPLGVEFTVSATSTLATWARSRQITVATDPGLPQSRSSIANQIQGDFASNDPTRQAPAEVATVLQDGWSNMPGFGRGYVSAYNLDINVNGRPYTDLDVLTPYGPIEVTTDTAGKVDQIGRLIAIAPGNQPVILVNPNGYGAQAAQQLYNAYGDRVIVANSPEELLDAEAIRRGIASGNY